MDEFIRTCIVKDKDSKVSQKVMYENYLLYCQKVNEKPRSKIWFGRDMKMFGYGSTLNSKGELEHLGMRLICKY